MTITELKGSGNGGGVGGGVMVANSDLRKVVNDELDKKGSGGAWLWKIFFLCVTPNILNGFHLNSYIFLAKDPSYHFCMIDVLKLNGWTDDQFRNFTLAKGLDEPRGCSVLNYNYTEFVNMSYKEATTFASNRERPEEVPCMVNDPANMFYYNQEPGESIVSEFGLVCDNLVMRSNIQMALSLGKFFAASSFGVFSDRFGRKTAFMMGCVIYIISGLTTVLTTNYWLLFFGRMGIGASSSALFYPAFTLLTENISQKHRSWMSVVFTISYPIGMLIMACCALYLPLWRNLQFALIAPGLLLVIHCYFLDESPRWLISKNRDKKAYKILFGRNPPPNLIKTEKTSICEASNVRENVSFGERLRRSFSEFFELFSTPKLRKEILICYFAWCVTSMTYYTTALNAVLDNKILYVFLVGVVDIPSYFLPILMLRYLGRRLSATGLYIFTGVFLLLLLTTSDPTTKMVYAMCGRFGISAVYAVITLHTAELFPTEVRSSALGTCSTMAHVGSISAPYIVDLLGLIAAFIPNTICGALALCAGLLILLLPETQNKNLTDHVEDEVAEDSISLDEEKAHMNEKSI